MRRYIQWKVDRVGGQDWVSLDTYKENEVYGENFAKPPPELENNEEFYVVLL